MSARSDPVANYVAEVIHGPLAFVEVAHSHLDYARAMKRKHLRELAPNLVQRDGKQDVRLLTVSGRPSYE